MKVPVYQGGNFLVRQPILKALIEAVLIILLLCKRRQFIGSQCGLVYSKEGIKAALQVDNIVLTVLQLHS